MPVRIRIYGQEATFAQGRWVCPDPSLEAMLQALADPRALTPEEEVRHARYAAGRYGGVIATDFGWEAAPLPEPEIRMEDFAPAPRPAPAQRAAPAQRSAPGGWLGFLRKRG